MELWVRASLPRLPRITGMRAALAAALLPIAALLLPSKLPAQVPSTAAAPARHFHVEFGPLPEGWTQNREVMDPHWVALRATGTNYYALGAARPGRKYVERSDPGSRFYQAWFGVYAVDGHGDLFRGHDRNGQFAWLARLAEFDQSSWLEAMGDPHPLARWTSRGTPHEQVIAGAARTSFTATMKSHSDVSVLGPQSTPLARALGMPNLNVGRVRVGSFHPLTLRGFYAFWYDAKRKTTFVVYGVSSAFTDKNGRAHDNAIALRADFKRLLANVRIVDD